MGKPAATLGCYHTCPDKTGKKRHVGGPIIAGSGNVMVGAQPAARVGDKLVCRGPNDTIAKGSGSVFINGKPAARVGDRTAQEGRLWSVIPWLSLAEHKGTLSWRTTPAAACAAASSARSGASWLRCRSAIARSVARRRVRRW